ncbi:M14 family metallopeptidase [Henriciella algicola]|uniref:Carboxypeptidase n=1 Tax=Henriciella algicola TaxID=1608422 RepID=A0A399RLX4_9PROT|nr:M14 family metallopeptidase [Henriciella algicola]RIJ30842.1 carboxypeptidase [Henriciella algicola]
MKTWVIAAAGFCSAVMAGSAEAQSFLNIQADPSIPTLEEVAGHAPGDEISTVTEARDYMEALAEAAPDRMQITPYAESWEGRELFYAVISSPENLARLNEIKANMSRLASGELSAGERSSLINETPAVVWLSYGVHGNEISSTDAGLALAYHLLAAEGDQTVDTILSNTIVVIDPMQNPDGRARFTNSFEAARGITPFADRYTAEHDEPWPGGRFNHYLFDMNRDWFTLSQPETRGRVSSMLEWHPVVVVDAHEMGGDESYFFAPAADPFNPNITEAQKEKQVLIGRNHARWFDQRGYDYFTREVFDAFYPGYGDMWPTLGGAIAMTYEQGSARGLAYERSTGDVLTYKQGVEQHFVATLSTAEVVANNQSLFLNDFASYRREAAAEARGASDRYFVFDLSDRRWQAEQLGRKLAAQDITVQRLSPGAQACGVRYPDGALVVDRAQPSGKRITTLLSEDTSLPEDFVDEQESRRDRGLNHELYDVTAWSMPLMEGVTSRTCGQVNVFNASMVSADDPVTALTASNAAYGYVVPWSDAGQAKLVLSALDAGLTGRATTEAFTVDGREYPRGSVVFPLAANESNLATTLNGLATEIGAEYVALQSSWVEDGPNYGSDKFVALTMPKVAMAWGEGTSATDAGAARFVLERELGIPVAPIRVGTLPRANLGRYDVLILPDAGWGFEGELGVAGKSAIATFTRNGGVLIGFEGALGALTSGDDKLLSARAETAYLAEEDKRNDGEEAPASGLLIESDEDYDAVTANQTARPDSVPGVLANVIADTDHWLSSGYEEAVALYQGSTIYRPLNDADGANVFRYAAADELVASGYLWEENRAQLAYKPYLMAEQQGAGVVIAFTQSPVTRAYLDGLNLLLVNAVLFGPAHTR